MHEWGGDLGAVAEQLGMSVKTLRRRLSEQPFLKEGFRESVGWPATDPLSGVATQERDPHVAVTERCPTMASEGERNRLIARIRQAIADAQSE